MVPWPHLDVDAFRCVEPVDEANLPRRATPSSPGPWISARRRQVFEPPSRRRPELAPREKEVLITWLLTDNKNVAARQLHVSPATVRTHLQRIRAKYAAVGRPARTKASLVARALQDGLIEIDDL